MADLKTKIKSIGFLHFLPQPKDSLTNTAVATDHTTDILLGGNDTLEWSYMSHIRNIVREEEKIIFFSAKVILKQGFLIKIEKTLTTE